MDPTHSYWGYTGQNWGDAKMNQAQILLSSNLHREWVEKLNVYIINNIRYKVSQNDVKKNSDTPCEL